jgi:hypothetical protein
VDAGIAPVLIAAGKMLLHKEYFAEVSSEIMAWYVLAEYSSYGDEIKLVNAEFCDYCICIMKKYVRNSKISCYCLRVIYNLCQCDTNKQRLQNSGVIDSIIDAIQIHCLPSKKFNRIMALEAIVITETMTWSQENDFNVATFVKLGMCEMIIALLQKYATYAIIDWVHIDPSQENSLLDFGQRVIRNLASNVINRRRLASLGAGNWIPELI